MAYAQLTSFQSRWSIARLSEARCVARELTIAMRHAAISTLVLFPYKHGNDPHVAIPVSYASSWVISFPSAGVGFRWCCLPSHQAAKPRSENAGAVGEVQVPSEYVLTLSGGLALHDPR